MAAFPGSATQKRSGRNPPQSGGRTRQSRPSAFRHCLAELERPVWGARLTNTSSEAVYLAADTVGSSNAKVDWRIHNQLRGSVRHCSSERIHWFCIDCRRLMDKTIQAPTAPPPPRLALQAVVDPGANNAKAPVEGQIAGEISL